jgi:mRNA-degrading endonuclease RelE of RelBE toxin-antitoxin system
MVDRVEKTFRKMSDHDRGEVEKTVARIIARDFVGLDMKKLAGRRDAYRVRKGAFRIIFLLTPMLVQIIAVERRSETTYG